ncbi:hypothetical protein [Nocardioides sp. SR21]|uniref:hypothetical protein n=1 Tax=Nocardioides sp. SR21 TaxID=2919501 RepID=UPI001FAA2839|nr:hypothetical protein [Nocardioides sp. SR21]
MLPVFPNDQVERGPGEPLVYHDETYEDGDPIALGGGMIEGSPEGADVPAGCQDDLGAWGVIQG